MFPVKQRPRGVCTKHSMDSTEQAPEHVTQGVATAQAAPENKPDTDLNPVSRAPNLRFPVLEFFSKDLDLWFFQLEALFIVNRVMTENDKYAVVVANLPFKVVCRILMTLATEDKPHTVLKELVVKETDLSDYQRSEKLHALPALGDKCPSELLASIRNLQPMQDCGCYCSRYQFLSRMPPITRAQLVNQKDLTMDELAAFLDTIMLSQANVQALMPEVTADQHNAEVLAVHQHPSTSASLSPTKEKKKVMKVKQEV